MSEKHICNVTTLENQDWWKKSKNKKGTVLYCQHLSSLQVSDVDSEYYHEVANEGCRGAVATDDIQPNIFDVAVNPSKGNIEDRMKEGFLALLKEKVRNDLVVYNKMIEHMMAEGIISEPDAVEIDMADIASKMIEGSNGGYLAKDFLDMSSEERREAIEDQMYVRNEEKQKIRAEVRKIAEQNDI